MNIHIYIIILLSFLSFNVIITKNPMIAMLYLILTFIVVSLILAYLNFCFLSILLLLIYVGAIAMLLIFVIILLNIRLIELNNKFWKSTPIGFILGNIFFINIYIIDISNNYKVNIWEHIHMLNGTIFFFNDLEHLGSQIYSFYCLKFILSSLALLLAMISVLSLSIKS